MFLMSEVPLYGIAFFRMGMTQGRDGRHDQWFSSSINPAFKIILPRNTLLFLETLVCVPDTLICVPDTRSPLSRRNPFRGADSYSLPGQPVGPTVEKSAGTKGDSN